MIHSLWEMRYLVSRDVYLVSSNEIFRDIIRPIKSNEGICRRVGCYSKQEELMQESERNIRNLGKFVDQNFEVQISSME